MGIIMKLMPARFTGYEKPENEVVADIDAIGKPIEIKFNGRFHRIRSPNGKDYARLIQIWNQLIEFAKSEDKNNEEKVLQITSDYFSILCSSITYPDVCQMSIAQRAALIRVYNSHIGGSLGTDEKKNSTPSQPLSH